MSIAQYEVRVTSPAARDLNRVPQKILPAILDFIYGPLAHNPHRVGAPLGPPLDGLYGARRGSYRIIYKIETETVTVHVVRVGHRADIYRTH